jgi:alkylation response protein AidB-like acyl-CoA dehydrogenase
VIITDTGRKEDLQALQEVTREFLSSVDPHEPVERTARLDRALWRRACTELGVAGVDVPESHGGLGGGFAGVAVVLEEAGRTLAALPLLQSVVLAQRLLLRAGDEELVAEFLPQLLAGDAVAVLADQEHPNPGASTPTRAALDGDRWRLSGTRWAVLDGMSADLALVPVTGDRGSSLFLVDLTAPGVRRTGAGSLDLTRDFANLELDGAAGRLVGAEGTWDELEPEIRPLRTLAVACESLGSGNRCLEAAVEYAKQRVQFGRAIGSFQAIKHTCAEVAVELDDARSAVAHAVWCVDTGSSDLTLAAAMAGATATQAHLRATADNVQVHGGIGFTWEHTAHLHFRRAHSNAALFGDVRHHREEVLRALQL